MDLKPGRAEIRCNGRGAARRVCDDEAAGGVRAHAPNTFAHSIGGHPHCHVVRPAAEVDADGVAHGNTDSRCGYLPSYRITRSTSLHSFISSTLGLCFLYSLSVISTE